MRANEEEVMAQESFERWLLHRVARAVEQEDLSADVLMELQREMVMGRVHGPDPGPAAALRRIADLLEADHALDQDAPMDLAFDPEVDRERLLREVAESWLADQTERHRRQWKARSCGVRESE
jgi:hypothetical protein